MIWETRHLADYCNGVQKEINGKWVPARPDNYRYEGFLTRIRHAWMVLTGKVDCVIWDE